MSRISKLQSGLLFIARLCAPILTYAELRLHLYDQKTKESEYSPIFIIGSPRTGSTVLYQMLTHASDCLYIDNLTYAFFNNLPFGFWLSNKIFGNKSHGSFDSRYGNTDTWHSPSECGGFWYRWFSREQDFVNYGALDDSSVVEMKSNINSIMNQYKKNILFKNLNASQRIRVLQEVFPRAKFIYIKRDPLHTAQSLLLAREKAKIPDDKWWSVKPKNYEELNNLPLYEKLVSQVFYIEQQIVTDLKNIDSNSIFIINYIDIKRKFKQLSTFIGCKPKNEMVMNSFEFSNKNSLSNEMLLKFKMEVAKHDWSELGYDQ